MLEKRHDQPYTYEDLLAIMAELRGENGCPWDLEQTHESVKDAVVEEAYELVEAINNQDLPNMEEELGDILLQVVFHSQIAKESNEFTIEDVIDTLASKLIRRHPHVFASLEVDGSDQVLENWDAIKLDEKSIKNVTQDLRQVPRAMPSMMRAKKVQKKASKSGMDFESIDQVFDKLQEEIEELRSAIDCENDTQIGEEFGDLLFTMVNLSRFLGLNPENALTNALEKFITRFEGIETLAKASGEELSKMSPQQLDRLWNIVKKD